MSKIYENLVFFTSFQNQKILTSFLLVIILVDFTSNFSLPNSLENFLQSYKFFW
jgi:hypothetical protein